MSATPRSQTRYTYRFSMRAEEQNSFDADVSRDEIQEFVNASLGMLTGGCERCEFAHRNNSPALFCEKKKCTINWGSPRCEHFVCAVSRTQNLLA